MESNEDSDNAARRHRGAGKSLTWDQFSFDKILPSLLQGEFSEHHENEAELSPNLKSENADLHDSSRITWFSNDYDGNGSPESPLGIHKRSATIATSGLMDSFDLGSLTLSHDFMDDDMGGHHHSSTNRNGPRSIGGDGSGKDSQGGSLKNGNNLMQQQQQQQQSSSFLQSSSTLPSKSQDRDGELETIAEAGFRSPPRHRRSHTHATTTSSFSLMGQGGAGPSSPGRVGSPDLSSFSTSAGMGNNGFGAWSQSLGESGQRRSPGPGSGHLSRTKSELTVSGIDLESLREEVDAWKLFHGESSSTHDRPSPNSAASAKANSVPGRGGSPLLRSPSASSAASSPDEIQNRHFQQEQTSPADSHGYGEEYMDPGAGWPQWGNGTGGGPGVAGDPSSPSMMGGMSGYGYSPNAGNTPMMSSVNMGYGSGPEGSSGADSMMMHPWMQYGMYYPSQTHYGQPNNTVQNSQYMHPHAHQQHSNHPHQPGFYGMAGHMSPPHHVEGHSPTGGPSGMMTNHAGHQVNAMNRGGIAGAPGKTLIVKVPPSMKVMCPALVEYRSSGRRPSMEELMGHVVEFSRDAHGSRFIQFKMETASVEEKEILVDEVVEDAIGLMQDTFGNYVLQNFLEHATEHQRYKIGSTMEGHMVQLSSQAHGCRVVQRAILLLPKSLRNKLLSELLMNPEDTSKCARNSHATHVMQKVVSLIVEEEQDRTLRNQGDEMFQDAPSTSHLLRAVEHAVELDFSSMSVHPHAYRLVLTVMDDCQPHRSDSMRRILDVILPENMSRLAKDQHGNFILQHILNRGSEDQKNQVQRFVSDHVVELAQHKFGSHLVEKCLSCANADQVESLVQQLIHPTNLNSEQSRLMAHNAQVGQRSGKGAVTKSGKSIDVGDDTLLLLMSDPYANFVVQRAFDASQGALRKQLTDEIKNRSDILSSFTYGRHILNCTNKDKSEKKKSAGKRKK